MWDRSSERPRVATRSGRSARSARLAAAEQRPEHAADEVLTEPRRHDLAPGPDRRVDLLLAGLGRGGGGHLLRPSLALGLLRRGLLRRFQLLLLALHLALELS